MVQHNLQGTTTAGAEFARKFCNHLAELRLQPGIHHRIERLIKEFSEVHPNLRGSYLSRHVDPKYFEEGVYGWEAGVRPKLHALALSGDHLHEFIAFSNGFRRSSTPLETISSVEEVWLEAAPDSPFTYTASLTHSFPSVTLLYAPEPEGQDAAALFIDRIKYLRGM